MPPTLSLSLCLSNSCIFSLRLSLFLSSCLSYFLSLPAPQQAGQMAAPRPALPEKACELKVIPSRFEELPALSRCGGRGALAHLPPRLRDIWLGFCGMMSTRPPAATATATPTGTGPKGEAVICSVFHQANEQMVYLLVCVDLCFCICLCVWEMTLYDPMGCKRKCEVGCGPHYEDNCKNLTVDKVYTYIFFCHFKMSLLIKPADSIGCIKYTHPNISIYKNFRPCKCTLYITNLGRGCQVHKVVARSVDVDWNRLVTGESLTIQPVSNLPLIPSQYVSPCLL